MRNGVVLGAKGYLRDMILYVPLLWEPSRMVYSKSPQQIKVEGPTFKVLDFGMREVVILIAQLMERYVGLYWQYAQLKVDADYLTKQALETMMNLEFRGLSPGGRELYEGIRSSGTSG